MSVDVRVLLRVIICCAILLANASFASVDYDDIADKLARARLYKDRVPEEVSDVEFQEVKDEIYSELVDIKPIRTKHINRNIHKKTLHDRKSVTLEFDRYMSSSAFATLTMTGLEAYNYAAENITKNSTVLKVLSLFVTTPVSILSFVANHEIGGHGYTVRRNIHNGWASPEYEIGLEGGVTKTKFQHYNFNIFEYLHHNIAGMQSSDIMARKILKKAFLNGYVSVTDCISYSFFSSDQYTYFTSNYDSNPGNDAYGYLSSVNALYGSQIVKLNDVRAYSFLRVLFNPASFTIITRLSDSFKMFKEYYAVPFVGIPIGSVRYIPVPNALLTPYGVEKLLANHFMWGDADDIKYAVLDLSFGSNIHFSSYTARLEADNLFKIGNISYGFDAAIWSQPFSSTTMQNILDEMMAQNGGVLPAVAVANVNPSAFIENDPSLITPEVGGMFMLKTSMKVNDNFTANVSFGYKTKGFIQGMSLESAAIFAAGFGINM